MEEGSGLTRMGRRLSLLATGELPIKTTVMSHLTPPHQDRKQCSPESRPHSWATLLVGAQMIQPQRKQNRGRLTVRPGTPRQASWRTHTGP